MATSTSPTCPPIELPKWWIVPMFLAHMLFWRGQIMSTEPGALGWLWLLLPCYPMWVQWRSADAPDSSQAES